MNPFNKAEHYHDYCMIQQEDFNNHNLDNIIKCRLAGLADLNQDNQEVESLLLNWISSTISKYQIDGLRIDTVAHVKKDFWTKFQKAAGVYTVGEVFDGNMWYLAPYNGPLSATLNYPFFFTAKSTFCNSNNGMNAISNMYTSWKQYVSDISLMGTFVDNHDNSRFLHDCGLNSDQKIIAYRSALTLTLTGTGIPIVYYGTEQGFAGGNDPQNREVLWNNMNTDHQFYTFIASVIRARKNSNISYETHVERYQDSEIYAFTRGNFFVAVTNKFYKVTKHITYHPFKNGEKICNFFWPKDDCLTVSNNSFDINLMNGESKIYVPASQLQEEIAKFELEFGVDPISEKKRQRIDRWNINQDNKEVHNVRKGRSDMGISGFLKKRNAN